MVRIINRERVLIIKYRFGFSKTNFMVFDIAFIFCFVPFETVYHGGILVEKFTAPIGFYQWLYRELGLCKAG